MGISVHMYVASLHGLKHVFRSPPKVVTSSLCTSVSGFLRARFAPDDRFNADFLRLVPPSAPPTAFLLLPAALSAPPVTCATCMRG